MREVLFTTDARIDRSGRHVMTPEAFAAWVSSASWTPELCNEFAFSDRPVPMELPLGYAYARTVFSITPPQSETPVSFTVYYFVEPGENLAPHYDDGFEGDIGEYILRVDWLHTLGIGGSGWLGRGSSVLNRTRLNGSYGVYDAGKLKYYMDEVLGQSDIVVTNRYGYVLEVITKRTPTTIFGGNVFIKELLVCRTPHGADTAADVLNKIGQAVVGLNKMEYFPDAQSSGETVDMVPIAVHLVPRDYIPASLKNDPADTPYYRNSHGYNEIFKRVLGEVHYNRTISYTTDAARYENVIGNGAITISLPPTTATYNFRVVSHFSETSGFSISATIDGRGVDLTPQCRVPFEVVDEASAQTNGQQKALQLATSAISVGVGVATQNPVAVVGGLISGASQLLTSPSAAPMQSSGGDCYSQQMYARWGLIHAVKFSKDEATVFVNVSRGPVGSFGVEDDTISEILSEWNDATTPHVCYMEGDVYLTRAGSTLVDKLFEQYADRLTIAFADGVFVWTSASHYRGNLFA